jgi:hypothetical protein
MSTTDDSKLLERLFHVCGGYTLGCDAGQRAFLDRIGREALSAALLAADTAYRQADKESAASRSWGEGD